MNNLYLLIDVSNLMHRALHTTGGLTHPLDPRRFTGCLYGVWKTCEYLQTRYATENLCFFFDSKHKDLRQKYLPEYKAQRKVVRDAEDPIAKERRIGMYEQTKELDHLLTTMQCDNIHKAKFYEADDLIASACRSNDVSIVIVSGDSDLWQLLGPAVSCFNPVTKVEMTHDKFIDLHKIQPAQWASVKAWMGDKSDNIPGIKGIGPKTAISYIRGTLKQSDKYVLMLDPIAKQRYEQNLKIIQLPLESTPAVYLTRQRIPLNWRVLADHIGSKDIERMGLKPR